VTTEEIRRAYLGHEVVVTLAKQPRVCVVGTLLDATDDGEVRIRLPDGRVTHAWPLLEIEPRYVSGPVVQPR
jgi:hypothetical protein